MSPQKKKAMLCVIDDGWLIFKRTIFFSKAGTVDIFHHKMPSWIALILTLIVWVPSLSHCLFTKKWKLFILVGTAGLAVCGLYRALEGTHATHAPPSSTMSKKRWLVFKWKPFSTPLKVSLLLYFFYWFIVLLNLVFIIYTDVYRYSKIWHIVFCDG